MEARISFWQESDASGFWAVWMTETEQTSFQRNIFFRFYWKQCIILQLKWFTQKSWKLQISIFCSKKIDLAFNHQIGIFLAAKYHLSFRTIITSRRDKLVDNFFCVFLKCSRHLQHLCIFSSSCWWNHTHLVIINCETYHFKKKKKGKHPSEIRVAVELPQ